MTTLEWSILSIVAAAFAVLVGVVIFALLQIRRSVEEIQRTFTTVKAELVLLIDQARQTSEQAGLLVEEVRDGFHRTSSLWNALGDLGGSLQRAQDFAREKGAWIARLFFKEKETERATHTGRNQNGNE